MISENGILGSILKNGVGRSEGGQVPPKLAVAALGTDFETEFTIGLLGWPFGRNVCM